MAKAEILVFFLLCISTVYAADHVVGGKNGWLEILEDYAKWAAGQKFVVGDKLIFNYELTHDVVELDKDGYSTCVVPTDTPSYTGGQTTITLTLPGPRYFICSISDHCSAGGMKLAITVTAGNTSGSTPPAPPPSGTPPSDIPPTATPPGPSDIPPTPPPSEIPSAATPPAPSVIPPSPGPASVPPTETPGPSPSTNPPSAFVPFSPTPSQFPPPSDLPPATPPQSPPPPSAATFGTLNPVLIGISLILATLFAFTG